MKTAEDYNRDAFYDELNISNVDIQDTKRACGSSKRTSDNDDRPALLSLKIGFLKGSRAVQPQPKIEMAGLKDEECRTKFRQRVYIHVLARTRKKLRDAESFTKCTQDVANETLPGLLPREKFPFEPAKT
ncbi:hypothetical protein RB195_024755 [Necator americanus]|uniref:Uncharacterized protein n=1 Tax=Necator americanus TaxID=51031 RepID=A0ABR1EPM1_NECAM